MGIYTFTYRLIDLTLTPDDFTCQRETPWALKG